jgi:predicted dehydrogenase
MKNLALLSAAHTHTRGYVDNINERDDCRLVSLWDDVEDRGRRYSEECGADYSADLASVVERVDVDGFIICAENTGHLPLLEAAIPMGKPIFCEKPLATKAADAKRALMLAREHDTILHMGYFQPFAAEMQGVITCIESGKLGSITHIRYRNAHHAAYGRWFDKPDLAWFASRELAGGGAFMDMGTHAVHLVRTVFGPTSEVFATIGNVSGIYPDVDDNGLALCRLESGALATIEASWVQTGGLSGLEVTGSEGTLFNNPGQGYVVAAPQKEAEPVAPGTERPRAIDRLIAAISGEIGAEELDADLVCAVDAVAVMEACYRSQETGTWMSVESV